MLFVSMGEMEEEEEEMDEEQEPEEETESKVVTRTLHYTFILDSFAK